MAFYNDRECIKVLSLDVISNNMSENLKQKYLAREMDKFKTIRGNFDIAPLYMW